MNMNHVAFDTGYLHCRLIVKDFGSESIEVELRTLRCVCPQTLTECGIITQNHSLAFNGVLYGLWSEVVNDRVKAAVGHCYAEGNGVDGSDNWFHKAAAKGLGADQRIEDQVDVVGDEAEAEDEQVDDDHPQDLGFVELTSAADGLGFIQRQKDHGWTEHVEHQREDEAHCLDEYHHLGQLQPPLLVGEVLKAVDGGGVDVSGRSSVQEEPSGQTARQHQHPHGAAGQLGFLLGANRLGPERVHDGQETVHADAREEEDATVHIGIEQWDGELAGHTAKWPVTVDEVEDSKRQGEDKE